MTAEPLPGGLVTLLLGDIEGSVRAWESNPAAMAAAARRFDEMVSLVCADCEGSRPLEQGEGDSFVVAFRRASDAIGAAVSLQIALMTEPWPGELDLRVRMAVHMGEVEFRDESNYVGATINRCARLRSLARGGQVLVSGATREVVSDAHLCGVTFRDLGLHELRDLPRPEHVYQLCHPDLPDRFPPLAGSAEVVGAPPEITSFVGRQSEIDELQSRLAASRLVTLTGSAGCGKSRLAARVAARRAPDEPDGAWWVGLADVADGGSVSGAVASALGVSWLKSQNPLDAIVSALATKKMLVVLDNCEHVLTPCVELVERVLRECADVRFLATSREQLGTYGEVSWRVPSLPVPEPGDHDLDGIEAHAGVQLFVDRARQVRPNFELTAQNAAVVAEICRRVDGIPLAIELTAARARLLGLEQIAEGLRDRFLLLGVSARGNVARQRTLQASVDWSYALLDDDERTVLRRLGVFSGGFTLDAAERVCADDGIDSRHILDVLGRLVDKSLIYADVDAAPARYMLLETIREYARIKLVDAGEAGLVQDRHLTWIVELGERLEPGVETADRGRLLDALEAELGNIRSAIAWAIDCDAVDKALRLAAALWPLWLTRVPAAEGHGYLSQVLALPGGDRRLRTAAVLWHANLALICGDLEAALSGASRAVAMAREVGDTFLLRSGLANLGWCLLFAAPSEALAALVEAHGLHDSDGPSNSVAETLSSLAWLEAIGGDWEAADRHLAEAVTIGRRTGDESVLAFSLLFQGGADVIRGRVATADACFRESLLNGARLRDGLLVPIIWSGRCWVLALRGDYDAAEQAADSGQRLARDAGSEIAEAHVMGLRGFLECRRGNWQRAEQISREAAAWFGQWGSNWYTRRFGLDRARALFIGGDRQGAADALAAAKQAAEAEGDHLNLALAALLEAELSLEDDPVRSEAIAHEALALAERTSLAGTVVECLDVLGCVAVERGDLAAGARILAAVDRVRVEMEYVRSVPEVERDRRYTTIAREALGDEAFEAAVAEGQALELPTLLAYVRRGRGTRKRPASGWASLTPAELEVASLVSAGLSNAETAEKLFISSGTVKVHLAHIYAKLGVGSRAALASEYSRRTS